MKKTLPVHPLPDRKNNFKIWVDQIRHTRPARDTSNSRPVIKSIYIRKSGNNLSQSLKKWNSIQTNTKDKYFEKLELMEEIRERKMENRTINFIYTPRCTYPKISAGK